jgi:hypothetical protein
MIVCAEVGICISTMMDCPLENPFPEPITRGIIPARKEESQQTELIKKEKEVKKELKEISNQEEKIKRVHKLEGIRKLHMSLLEEKRNGE